jgi:hypothetical protein
VQLIPEICWKSFFVSEMKDVYLINYKKDALQTGLSHFNLRRFFENDNFGKKYKDNTIWL